MEWKQKKIIELKRQFSHPQSHKRLTLLKDSNVVYSELEKCIIKLNNEC